MPVEYKFFNWVVEVNSDGTWHIYYPGKDINEDDRIGVFCGWDGEQRGFWFSAPFIDLNIEDEFWDIAFNTHSRYTIKFPFLWKYLYHVHLKYYPLTHDLVLFLGYKNAKSDYWAFHNLECWITHKKYPFSSDI